jgi:hypothetical protein
MTHTTGITPNGVLAGTTDTQLQVGFRRRAGNRRMTGRRRRAGRRHPVTRHPTGITPNGVLVGTTDTQLRVGFRRRAGNRRMTGCRRRAGRRQPVTRHHRAGWAPAPARWPIYFIRFAAHDSDSNSRQTPGLCPGVCLFSCCCTIRKPRMARPTGHWAARRARGRRRPGAEGCRASAMSTGNAASTSFT